MTVLEDLTRSYRVAFLRYLARGEEAALHSGYELGRSAVAAGVSILELAQVHHEVLVEALQGAPAQDVPALARSASELFLEVLATFDMAQRAFGEADGG